MLSWYSYFGVWTAIIPFLAGLLFFKRISPLQRVFWGYIIYSILIEVVTGSLAMNGIHTLHYFILFLIGDVLFFSWFFSKSKPFKTAFKLLTVSVMGFIVVNRLLGVTGVWQSNADFWFFLTIFLFFIVQSAYVVYQEFDVEKEKPHKYSILLIAFARMMYFLITVLVYLYPELDNKAYKSDVFGNAQEMINGLGNGICYIIYGLSFLSWKKVN